MDNYKFSLIIPVYNSEATLKRCIDSILSQNRCDLQVLLINDGSTDRSGIICRKYAEMYPYIVYFEKENGGVSTARNQGLNHAEGQYVLFVDSDDYVAKDYFDSIDGALGNNPIDLLVFGCANSTPTCRSGRDDAGVYKGVTSCSKYAAYLMSKGSFFALWSKCFSNDIIQKNMIRFDEEIDISEDLHFIISYMMYVESMKVIPETLYYVDESNHNSLSRRQRPDLGEQLMHSSLSMKTIVEKASIPEKARKHYAKAVSILYYRSVYSVAKELNKRIDSAGIRRKLLRQICEEYSNHGVPAIGVINWLIKVPVNLKMVRAIDCLARGRS